MDEQKKSEASWDETDQVGPYQIPLRGACTFPGGPTLPRSPARNSGRHHDVRDVTRSSVNACVSPLPR
jgi:hypothetical protein